MNTVHILNIGFKEPTTIYELTPKKVGEFSGMTLNGTVEMLLKMNASNIIVDSGDFYKDEINNALIANGFNLLIVNGNLEKKG